MASDQTGESTSAVPPVRGVAPATSADPVPTGPSRACTWRRSIVGFLLLFGILGVWSLSQPRWAAPDEPAQAIRAAGAADGQIFGKNAPALGASTATFIVPAALGATSVCYAFKPTVSAACEPQPTVTSARIEQASYVGRYPPLYYVIVGLPSRLDPSSPRQLYYMRLVSAALSAMFLCAALVSAAQVRGRRWVIFGAAVTVTPMVVFLGSVVNPSGLEISSALCMWTSGLALLDGPLPRYRRRLLVWTTVSASAFVQVRGLSPLLLLIAAVLLGLLVGRQKIVALLRQRDAQVGTAVIVAFSLFAVWWILSQHVLVSSMTPGPVVATQGIPYNQAFTRNTNVHEMIGVFGWLDTYIPLWCYRVVETILWVLLGLAVLRRRWRVLGVAVLLAAVVASLTTALSLHERAKFGIVGQARYDLPLAVGLPVLVAYAASASRRARTPWVLGVVAGVSGLALAVVQFVAFVYLAQRNRTGIRGPLFTLHAPFVPALPWILAVIAIPVLELAFLAWWQLQMYGPLRGPKLPRPPAGSPVAA
jgi:hypothetical protein